MNTEINSFKGVLPSDCSNRLICDGYWLSDYFKYHPISNISSMSYVNIELLEFVIR